MNRLYEAIKRHDASHCPFTLLDKIQKRLESTIQPVDEEKIGELVDEFLDSTESAFWIHTLNPIMNILELMVTKYVHNDLYIRPLKKLLKKCAIPPKLRKSSDSLDYNADLQEYLSVLGYLLVYLEQKKQIGLQLLLTQALYKMLKGDDQSNPINCVSPQVCIDVLEKSKLPEVLGQLLHIVNEEIFADMLKMCILISSASEEACVTLLKEDAINATLNRLEPTWMSRFPMVEPPNKSKSSKLQHYDGIQQMMWILLKCLDKNRYLVDIIESPKQFALWSLKYALRHFFDILTGKKDRNNVLFIVLYLQKVFNKMEFVNSGLALDIVGLNLACDMRNAIFLEQSVNLQSTNDDFVFRRALLLSLSYYRKSFSALRIIADEEIVRCLLAIVAEKQKVKWHAGHQSHLITLALDVLDILIWAPINQIKEEYIENSGPQIIAKCLMACSDDVYPPNVLVSTLTLMSHLNPIPQIMHASENLVICDILCKISNKTMTSLSLKEQEQHILAQCFHLLGWYENLSSNTSQVLTLLLNFLERILIPNFHDQMQCPKLMISAVQLLSQIAKTDENIDEIISKGVIYHILDVLSHTIFPVKIVILRFLVNLCANAKSIPYLLTWRKQSKKFVPLLLEIFREEGAMIGNKTGPNGEIDDLEYPIMGVQQLLEMKCDCAEKRSKNPAISDMFVSCRPNIYALLRLINTHYADVTELTKETYKLYNGELDTNDQITMLVADNYLDLKVAEAWKELHYELENQHYKYLHSDKFLINTLNERNKKWTLKLQIAQKECVRRKNEEEFIAEYNFYQELKDARLQPALQALQKLKYQARGTEKLFQLSKKILQNQMISVRHMDNAFYHRTFSDNPKFTVMFNQTIDVNEPIPVSKHLPLKLVSPPNSDDEVEQFPIVHDPLYKDDEDLVDD